MNLGAPAKVTQEFLQCDSKVNQMLLFRSVFVTSESLLSFESLWQAPRGSLRLLNRFFRHRIWPGGGSTVQWKWSPPSPGSLKALLFPPLLNKVEYKGTQGVQARYGAELPSIHFHCPVPRSSSQIGHGFFVSFNFSGFRGLWEHVTT